MPVPLLHIRALVVLLLAFRQADIELGAAARPVQVERHQRVAGALDLADQARQFLAVQQQLACATRVGLDVRGGGLQRGDMATEQEGLAVADGDVGFRNLRAPGAQRFDLPAFEREASLEAIFDKVFEAGATVYRDDARGGLLGRCVGHKPHYKETYVTAPTLQEFTDSGLVQPGSALMVPSSPGGYWHRGSGFMVASVLALVGAGVLLRLPQLAMEYGGGAFLCVYIGFLLLVAWPLLTTEWLFGRVMRQDLAGALHADISARGASRIWMLIAALMLLAPLVVASYYAVIAGWNVAFLLRASSGALAGADPENPSVLFLAVAQDAERTLAWFTIMVVACGVIAARGIRGGIETTARGLLWGVLLLLALLALAVARRGDWAAALQPWAGWNWSALGWRGILEALRQALFSAGLGLGMMAAYAGYLPERARLLRSAAAVLALSTLLAVVGGSLSWACSPMRLSVCRGRCRRFSWRLWSWPQSRDGAWCRPPSICSSWRWRWHPSSR